jgi:hypothetical protein
MPKNNHGKNGCFANLFFDGILGIYNRKKPIALRQEQIWLYWLLAEQGI